jgi:regulatory protein
MSGEKQVKPAGPSGSDPAGSGWDAGDARPVPPVAATREEGAPRRRTRDRAPRPDRNRLPADLPPPDAGRLRDAALAHLARFGTTEAGLVRVLDRRVARWVRNQQQLGAPPERLAAQAAAAREAVRAVARSLVGSGVVDDSVFAESRARSLHRSGRSRRAISAHLAAKGVDPVLADAVLPDGADDELAAAVAFARRRRVGPFARNVGDETSASTAPDPRVLAAFARAGFSRDVAERALSLSPEEAEEAVLALKRS